MEEIDKRPVLIDRMQITITPNYLDVYSIEETTKQKFLNSEYQKYKKILIQKGKQKRDQSLKLDKKTKVYKVRKFGEGENFHYYIDGIPSKNNYITKISINAASPFDMAFNINVIRYLKNKLKDDPNFNHEYDKQIFLDDDNYLNKKIWPTWDNNFVYDINYSLKSICLDLANNIFSEFVDYQIAPPYYKNVTVKQIETNVDYYVGTNQGLFYITKFYQRLTDFATLAVFRKKIGAIGEKHRIPLKLSEKPTKKDKNETVSIQFEICKGLFYKIYLKDKDEIRTELIFENSYLKTKFKKVRTPYNPDKDSISTSAARIIKPVLEFSKDFFKDLKFENYLNDIKNNNLPFLEQTSKLYHYYRQTDPNINDINSAIINNHPIIDKKTISYIRKNPYHSKHFETKYNSNGRKMLVISDIENIKLENFVCPNCGSENTFIEPYMKQCKDCHFTSWNTKTSKKRLLPYKTDKAPKKPKPVLKYVFLKPGKYQTSLDNKRLYIADTKPKPLTSLQRNFRSGSKLRKKNTKS